MSTKIRIFVVDDEPNITRTWCLILERSGYDVTAFSDAESALAAIRSNPPAVLLSDVGLPRMSGIELAITLLNESVPTHIILVSGQTTTADHLFNASEAGYSFEVLAKPVGPQTLLRRLQELCAAANE